MAVDPEQLALDQLFNTFCRVVEREIDDKRIWEALKKAPICSFDSELSAVVYDVITHADKMDLFLPPLMPFDDVVLIDSMSVTLLFGASDFERGEQLIDVTDFTTEEEQEFSTSVLRDMQALVFTCASPPAQRNWTLGYGRVSLTEPRGNNRTLSMEAEGLIVTGGPDVDLPSTGVKTLHALLKRSPDTAKRYHEILTQRIGISLGQLHYIDLPRHHVIVQEPTVRQHKPNAPKQARAHDRPRIKLIDPENIRQVYPSEALGGKRTVVPHARRGHTKYLTSPKWTNKQWTRIRIRPTWIGEPEWEIGAYRYRVLVRGNDVRSVAVDNPPMKD